MNICAYHRGNDNTEFSAAVSAFAADRGAVLSDTLFDAPPAVASFRRLQNYVKLGLCQCLIVESRSDLGDDEWLMLENELFMLRNGVRLVFMQKPKRDLRYGLVNAVKAYYMPRREWEVEHGDEMPWDFSCRDPRRLPFGYKVTGGKAGFDRDEAEKVIAVFRGYADGMSADELAGLIGEGSRRQRVYDILANERYTGAPSGSGARLPGLISLELWSRCAKRRGVNDDAPLEPFFPITRASGPFAYTRGGAAGRRGEAVVDADRLERELASFISGLAFGNAEVFYNDYVLPGLEKPRLALPDAEAARQRAAEEYNETVRALSSGARSMELQRSFASQRDALFTAGIRLRRVMTEEKLFSVTGDEVSRFFARAGDITSCVKPEREFIAKAFVKSLRLTEDKLTVSGVSPATGRLVKRDLSACVRFPYN